MPTHSADCPLRFPTPACWAAGVLADTLSLLNDHAHLEKKAAANALELIDRWPEPDPPAYWVEKMTAIARDEIDHLAIVSRLLAARGGRVSKHHRNPYARALRDLVRNGQGPLELIDRLMVSALIEARSCERFLLLAGESGDPELAALYRDLWASENGHYLTFIDLAGRILDDADAVERRWSEFLNAEAEIIRRQEPGPRVHSWIAEQG